MTVVTVVSNGERPLTVASGYGSEQRRETIDSGKRRWRATMRINSDARR